MEDYRKLRLLLNFVAGILFCSCLYYFGWKRLNFADFHVGYGIAFKWFMILSTAFTFALSPVSISLVFIVFLLSNRVNYFLVVRIIIPFPLLPESSHAVDGY